MSGKVQLDKLNNISKLIGNTPLIEIKFKYKENLRSIFVKLEYFNLSGSIKDRIALYMLKKAYEENEIREDYTIIEATSGNTGISFSAIGSMLGNKVEIYMPNWMSIERQNLIRSYGASIRLVSEDEGGFLGSIRLADERKIIDSKVYLPHQFSNKSNVEAHYKGTGPEIWEQIKRRGLTVDAFVAGVGTGGTVMGVGKYLKEKNTDIRICPLEPANSPTLSTGYKVGRHRIQGISDEFIPEIVQLSELDNIISVDDGDAIIMAQKLSRELGLGVGISSGANFIGAIKVQEYLGKGSVVTTVFSDDNKKYLSTDLMCKEEIKEGFYSSCIELLEIRGLK